MSLPIDHPVSRRDFLALNLLDSRAPNHLVDRLVNLHHSLVRNPHRSRAFNQVGSPRNNRLDCHLLIRLENLQDNRVINHRRNPALSRPGNLRHNLVLNRRLNRRDNHHENLRYSLLDRLLHSRVGSLLDIPQPSLQCSHLKFHPVNLQYNQV